MALTRKFLAALGIEDAKVDEIIQAHTDTVNGLKDEIEKYKADAEKLPGVQKELDKMKESAEQESKDPYKVKYEAMKEEFDAYKADITEKETARQKEEAYRELLKSAGISEKRINSVLKVTDLKSLKLDAEGKLEDKENLTSTIKTEWADFIVTEKDEGADVPKPPEKNPQPDYDKLSDEEYYKQTYEASKKK